MPIPTPNKGESQNKYVARCVRFFDDEDSDLAQKQRLAVCFKKYRNWKKNRRKRAKAKLAKSKNFLKELKKLKEYYDDNYRTRK